MLVLAIIFMFEEPIPYCGGVAAGDGDVQGCGPVLVPDGQGCSAKAKETI